MNFSGNLRKLRKEKHITQNELAELLNVDISTVKRYEYEMREPCLKTLESLADIFNISIDRLIR